MLNSPYLKNLLKTVDVSMFSKEKTPKTYKNNIHFKKKKDIAISTCLKKKTLRSDGFSGDRPGGLSQRPAGARLVHRARVAMGV